ncbi:MAG: hypothetical protein J6Y89_03345 [Lachnospiraceae bacterium]|nr:hypothetical protein [Lachnospiraceae bacterium]
MKNNDKTGYTTDPEKKAKTKKDAGKKAGRFKDLDKKEHPLRSFYPVAEVIYGWVCRAGKADVFGDREITALLSGSDDPETEALLDAYKTISYILMTLICTSVLVVLCLLATESHLLSGNRLSRAPSGQGESVYELKVADEEGTEKDITVTVSEQKCPEDKLDEFFEDATQKLKLAVIADNASADEVTGKLDLVREIPGTSIKVTFDDPDPQYIYYDGTIRQENVLEPVIITLTAELVYFDEIRIVSFPIRLVPAVPDESKIFEEKLLAELEAADTATLKEGYMILPDDIDGKKLGWDEKKDSIPGMIAVIGLITALGIIPAKSAELKKQLKQREKEMINDYPDIISKMSLLLTAGMTSRGAWEKICLDYERMKKKDGIDVKKGSRTGRYAYEEMVRTLMQMNLGRSESEAYEEFSNRCRVAAYQRMGSLLAKNIRRGSREIIGLLQSESENAMQERLQRVKEKGEEAGTKLLLPMFGMFGIVMAIVIVPAISSMGI